jgi:hypothetical protein
MQYIGDQQIAQLERVKSASQSRSKSQHHALEIALDCPVFHGSVN